MDKNVAAVEKILLKELASDEFVEKKIKDILGDNDVDSGKEE